MSEIIGLIKVEENGSKWAFEKPDPIEMLHKRLETYPLDPACRWTWKSREHKNARVYSGNFVDISAVFKVTVTIGSAADKQLAALYRRNRRLSSTSVPDAPSASDAPR